MTPPDTATPVAEERAVIRVVIVEDHTLVRQTLAKILGAEPGFRVVGEAGRRDEAYGVISATTPDLVLLDISMPGASGLEVAQRIKAEWPEVRVLFLTMHEDEATVSQAIALADGYVLKSASTDELLHALRAVAAGGSYLSPSVARRVMERAGRRAPASALTERELEILRLMAEGARPAEVAARLFVSVKTVRNHLASIYVKLDVQTATQAVGEAFRRGLVAPPTA